MIRKVKFYHIQHAKTWLKWVEKKKSFKSEDSLDWLYISWGGMWHFEYYRKEKSADWYIFPKNNHLETLQSLACLGKMDGS